ncbi:manganese efflux pump [Clostridiaceae bacterium M8S5]|nr:manganese efflux pump [Clostridiaceae bacterium M8S5]
MTIFNLLSISTALALDACGVSFSIGLNKKISTLSAKFYIFSFAIFQFLFAFIGGFLGLAFNRYIFSLPTSTGGIVLIIIGVFIFLGLFSKNESIKIANWYMIIGMGISVSIDALLIGFSVFNSFDIFYLFLYSCIIGLITAVLSSLCFVLSHYVKHLPFIEDKNDYISGIILILIGIKIIFC